MGRKRAPLTQQKLRENAEVGVIDDRDDEPYGHLREMAPNGTDIGRPPIKHRAARRRSHQTSTGRGEAARADVA